MFLFYQVTAFIRSVRVVKICSRRLLDKICSRILLVKNVYTFTARRSLLMLPGLKRNTRITCSPSAKCDRCRD